MTVRMRGASSPTRARSLWRAVLAMAMAYALAGQPVLAGVHAALMLSFATSGDIPRDLCLPGAASRGDDPAGPEDERDTGRELPSCCLFGCVFFQAFAPASSGCNEPVPPEWGPQPAVVAGHAVFRPADARDAPRARAPPRCGIL